ncbi:MAG: ribulose-phosphate 3-epimerase [Actinomycetota bacterium]|nr:ribulose-phosphate 3-epimerase [Actinomycetota bacterium]
MGKVKLAPSILNADFSQLGAQIREIQKYADLIHLDIMDGNFVPNITFGPLVVEAVKSITEVPLDVHLMIYNPPEWIDTFCNAGADRISFHPQACSDVESVLRTAKSLGVAAGLALSPEIPHFELKPYLHLLDFVVIMTVYPGFGGQKLIPEMLNRVGAVKRDASELGLEVEVEIDGGVKTENLNLALEAGCDTVVVGSSIFHSEDIAEAAREIRVILDKYSANQNRTLFGEVPGSVV